VPFLGSGSTALAKIAALGMDGKFARPGAEKVPSTRSGPDIEELVKLEIALPDGVQPDVDCRRFPPPARCAKPALPCDGRS